MLETNELVLLFQQIHARLRFDKEYAPIKSIEEHSMATENRRALHQLLYEAKANIALLEKAYTSLPGLADEQCIKWAQNLLAMESCLLLEVDTTGLGEKAEVCRITLGDIYGRIVQDFIIKTETPISEEATAVNSISNEMLENKPYLSEIWNEIVEALKGMYVVSFSQEWDRTQLDKAAKRNGLPPVFFLGECLQKQLTKYHGKTYGLTLAGVFERMAGDQLPTPTTSIERVRAQSAIIQAMACAVTDVRPPRKVETIVDPAPYTGTDDDGISDLDDHPF